MFISIKNSDDFSNIYVNERYVKTIEENTYGDGSVAGYFITTSDNKEYYTQDIESVLKVL